MKNNIVLIGMPGVGKSTAGVIAAKILGMQFVDTDLVIQERQQKLLSEIIKEKGVDEFITIEDEVNASLNLQNAVIATGGSVVYCTGAMEHFKEIGKIVYLKLGLDPLSKRLGSLKQRGVVRQKGQTIADIYKERVPLYEKYADIVIDETMRDIEQTVDEIVRWAEK